MASCAVNSARNKNGCFRLPLFWARIVADNEIIIAADVKEEIGWDVRRQKWATVVETRGYVRAPSWRLIASVVSKLPLVGRFQK